MKKLSLVEKITQGTEEAEKKKLATTESTEGQAPGDDSGDPLYNIPEKKTEEQMNQDPKEVLNADLASEMGAADTIESLIKKVVTEAIKEAATPEGHVDPSAMKDMGAPKMSAVKMSKTMNYRGFIIEIRDSSNGKTEIIVKGKDFGSGEVVDNVFVEEEVEAFKVGKEAIDEFLEKSKFSKAKMSRMAASESMIDNVDNNIDKLKRALEALDQHMGFFRAWQLTDDRVGSKIIEKINKLNNAIIDLMAIMKL